MNKRAPNPIDVHVGARIRMRRLLLGISQEKLADMLGLTFQQVQKYEKGINRVSASRLYQITNILNEPISFFFEGLSEKTFPLNNEISHNFDGLYETTQSETISDFLNTSEGVKLNRAFSSIRDPNIRKNIIDLVKSLAKEEQNKIK